jgi:hypothetical protein
VCIHVYFEKDIEIHLPEIKYPRFDWMGLTDMVKFWTFVNILISFSDMEARNLFTGQDGPVP